MPSAALEARFALDILDQPPHGAFVLDAEEICCWLQLAGVPEDVWRTDRSGSRSWLARLLANLSRRRGG